MRILQFMQNTPLRRRIRTLQAKLELLEDRVEQLELSIAATRAATRFPDFETSEKLSMWTGRSLTVLAGESAIEGTLASVQTESLELIDNSGQVVMIPFSRITAVRF